MVHAGRSLGLVVMVFALGERVGCDVGEGEMKSCRANRKLSSSSFSSLLALLVVGGVVCAKLLTSSIFGVGFG